MAQPLRRRCGASVALVAAISLSVLSEALACSCERQKRADECGHGSIAVHVDIEAAHDCTELDVCENCLPAKLWDATVREMLAVGVFWLPHVAVYLHPPNSAVADEYPLDGPVLSIHMLPSVLMRCLAWLGVCLRFVLQRALTAEPPYSYSTGMVLTGPEYSSTCLKCQVSAICILLLGSMYSSEA